MCRLLGYVSRQPQTFSQIVGENFDEFVNLANDHCDGWGIASSSHDVSAGSIYKEPLAATKSSHFMEEIQKSVSDGALMHLRWATKGMDVNENNTHPFTHNGISFIHNGSISPFDCLDSQISQKYLEMVKGTTDSERYFYFLLTNIDKFGFIEGVKSAVEYIKANASYSSINLMIMNQNTFIVGCIYNQDRIPEHFKNQLDYYHLKYLKTQDQIQVGSSGWNQAGWNDLENNTLLVIDRTTLGCSTINIS